MENYDHDYDTTEEARELEFKASLLATEFSELYKKFDVCVYTALPLQSAIAADDIRLRVSDLELSMCNIRSQLTTLQGRTAMFNLTFAEWERKQRLLSDLRREASMGNYGPASGKQRLIREVETQAHRLAVDASKRAWYANDCYRGTIVLGTTVLQNKCAELLGRVDNVTYSLQACMSAAVLSGNNCRYEQGNTVLNVLSSIKDMLAYLEQKLIELQDGIKATHDRQMQYMCKRAQRMLPQVVE